MASFVLFRKEETPQEWELVSLNQHVNSVIGMNIKRPKNFRAVANDETTAESKIEGLPNNNVSREWVWMVKDYIWEFIPTSKENIYAIKLVADDKPGMYLNYNHKQNKIITTKKSAHWKATNNGLKHIQSGKWLNISKSGELSLQKSLGKLNINLK